MAFDPDAYLAQSAFDPDAYLGKPAQPSFGEQLKKEVVNSLPVQLGLGAIRGAGSIGATLKAPFDYAEQGIAKIMGADMPAPDRRKAMDAALQGMGADPSSVGYNVGKIGSEIAGTAGIGGIFARGAESARLAPSLVDALRTGGMSAAGKTGLASIPARVAGGAVVGGASAGVAGGADDIGMGAALGGAIPVVGMAASGAGRMLRGQPDTELAEIGKKAQQYGIPVGIGDLTQSRALKATQSILRDAPFTGGMAQNALDAKQAAFNKAVGSQFGASEAKLTTDVIDKAKGRMGAEFDRIWGQNNLQVSPEMVSKMQELSQQASKLPKSEGQSLIAEINDLYSRMAQQADGSLVIDGNTANKFQSYLRRRAEGSAGLKNELGDLRQTIIKTFNDSVSPQDAVALTMNRSQYKAFKTVEPLLRSAEAGVAGRMPGDIPAALLPAAVAKNYRSGSPMSDLSQIGSQFLVDRVPQTGGSTRAALQNTAIGAALMGTGGIPALAAGIPAGIGIQAMLQSPRMAQLANTQNIRPLLEALRTSTTYGAPVIAAQ